MRTVKVKRTDERLIVTRSELAEILNANEDSVGRWARHDGLGAAVVSLGGSGAPQEFDLAMAIRWKTAKAGGLNHLVLEDYRIRAALPLGKRGDGAW